MSSFLPLSSCLAAFESERPGKVESWVPALQSAWFLGAQPPEGAGPPQQPAPRGQGRGSPLSPADSDSPRPCDMSVCFLSAWAHHTVGEAGPAVAQEELVS